MENSRSFERFKELELSRDEIDRLGDALKKEEFRQLLVDYVKEVQDPENQRKYEAEMTQLEKERGNDITFLHPTPCYVIKTSVDDSKKCFINICANDLVQKPYSNPSEKNGTKGLQWSLPHSMSPPSEDFDNKGDRCQVFDVLFHPDTLHLAQKNKAFRNMVNTVACKAVETQFNIKLDKNNLKFPKLKYKGMARPSVIRKPSSEGPIERTLEEKDFYDKLYAQAEHNQYNYPKKQSQPESHEDFGYTKPKFVIKQRRHVEFEEFTEHKTSKLNTTIPKELVVEVKLPLLKSANDIQLDVTEKTVQLTSEKPAKYKLSLTLPYRVDQDKGHAKFDKDLKQLVVTLPVVLSNSYYVNEVKEDSGVESDHGSPVSYEECVSEPQFRTKFLDANILYTLPEFTCHVLDKTIAFTLNVKNVDNDSVSKLITDNSIHVKFISVSPSYYNSHYAFAVKLPVESIDKNSVSIEVWDNNVILQLSYNCDKECTSYLYGLDEDELQEKYVEEPHILNAIQENSSVESKIQVTDNFEQQNSVEEFEETKILATSYESSGDELSCSFSPKRSKGILKRSLDRKFSRSVSESSLDDCIGSLDYESIDPVIPEETGEISTSLKKTVRFNDVVSRQLFRFNSSILGQKKKNQRKALKKKKALERRHSESEASEIEDRTKERDHKTENCDLKDDQSCKRDENIFHLDM